MKARAGTLRYKAWVGTLLALGYLANPQLAQADPADEARFHDQRARTAFAHRRFELALEEFFLSQRLAPNPRTDYNVALCFDLLGRDDDAYMYFEEFLADEASRDPELAELRRHAEESLVTLAKKVALVNVVSDPPGALIFVDKREHGSYGVAPRTLSLPPGEHRIWAELSGYRDASQTVNAARGATAQVNLAPKRILGSLLVKSSASGRVRVLDADRSVCAEGEVPFETQLPPGIYEISLAAPNYLPWRGLVNVRADEQVTQQISPEQRPGPTGDITVTSNVAGAVLALDGRPVGFAPTALPRIPVGRHQLMLRSEGVLPWRGEVEIRENERAWVTIHLDEPAVMTRSPVTWAVGGIGVASVIAGGIMAVIAGQHHTDFAHASETDKAALLRQGRNENITADVLLSAGVVALASSVYLYFSTTKQRGGQSAATVARDNR